jgi:hypothetical protein
VGPTCHESSRLATLRLVFPAAAANEDEHITAHPMRMSPKLTIALVFSVREASSERVTWARNTAYFSPARAPAGCEGACAVRDVSVTVTTAPSPLG